MLSLFGEECSSSNVMFVFLFCSTVASPSTKTVSGKQPVARVMVNKPWDKSCAISFFPSDECLPLPGCEQTAQIVGVVVYLKLS
jgi:hypothetical protein